jgi:hypothetical protein
MADARRLASMRGFRAALFAHGRFMGGFLSAFSDMARILLLNKQAR